MNVLCVGDVVGKPGRFAVESLLEELKKEYSVDFVIVNAENSAGGTGLTSRLSKHFFRMGCDVLTLGDHVWDQKELEHYLNDEPRVLRPSNFPEGAPGKGYGIYTLPNGEKIAVISLLGRVFIRYTVLCPFLELDKILKEIPEDVKYKIIDFHAEATSEKVALGWFADGRVSGVFGTHTHVQTADDKTLPQGTGYITDVGMTGPHDSVIGQTKENIIKRFLTCRPVKFQVASEDVWLNGVVFQLDDTTGFTTGIQRIQKQYILQDSEEKNK